MTCILGARTLGLQETAYLFVPALIGTFALFSAAGITAIMPGIYAGSKLGTVSGAIAIPLCLCGFMVAVLKGAKEIGRRNLTVPMIRVIALATVAIAAAGFAYVLIIPALTFVVSTIFAIVSKTLIASFDRIVGFWWSMWAPDYRACWDVRTGCLADDLIASFMTGLSTFATMLGIAALLMWVFDLYRRYR